MRYRPIDLPSLTLSLYSIGINIFFILFNAVIIAFNAFDLRLAWLQIMCITIHACLLKFVSFPIYHKTLKAREETREENWKLWLESEPPSELEVKWLKDHNLIGEVSGILDIYKHKETKKRVYVNKRTGEKVG